MSAFLLTGVGLERLVAISAAISGELRSSRIWASTMASSSAPFHILFMQFGSFTMLFICLVRE